MTRRSRHIDDPGESSAGDQDLVPDDDDLVEVSSAEVIEVGRRLAAAMANELLHTPPTKVGRSVFGGVLAVTTYVDDDPMIPRILDEARMLAGNPDRPPRSLSARAGRDHVVVLAHGDEWSLVASSAGPVLVLPDWASHILRIDQDPGWADEITSLVTALVQAARDQPGPPA